MKNPSTHKPKNNMKTTITSGELPQAFDHQIAATIRDYPNRVLFVIPIDEENKRKHGSLLRISPDDYVLCDTAAEVLATIAEHPGLIRHSSLPIDPTAVKKDKTAEPVFDSSECDGDIKLPALEYAPPTVSENPVVALKSSVGGDLFRPSLMGVYLDNKRLLAVATDGAQMVVCGRTSIEDYPLPGAIAPDSAAVNPYTNQITEEQFPNWESVVPDRTYWRSNPINIGRLYQYLKTLNKINSLLYVKASFQPPSEEPPTLFNPDVMLKVVESLMRRSVHTVILHGGRKGLLVIESANDSQAFGLTMPIQEIKGNHRHVLFPIGDTVSEEAPFIPFYSGIERRKPKSPTRGATPTVKPKKAKAKKALATVGEGEQSVPTAEQPQAKEVPTGEQSIPVVKGRLPKQSPDVGSALLSIAISRDDAKVGGDRDISYTGIIYDNERGIMAACNRRLLLTEPDVAPDERHGVYGSDGELIAEALPLSIFNPCKAMPDIADMVGVSLLTTASLHRKALGVCKLVADIGCPISIRLVWEHPCGTTEVHCDPKVVVQALEGLARLGVKSIVAGFGKAESQVRLMLMDADDWTRSAILPDLGGSIYHATAWVWEGEDCLDCRDEELQAKTA